MGFLKKNLGKVGGSVFGGVPGGVAGAFGDASNNGSGPGQAPTPSNSYTDMSRYEQVYNRPGYDMNQFVWGRDDERTYQDAYNAFRQLFGRAPSQNEWFQLQSAFQGPNSATIGRGYLANLQQQYKQNPSLD